MAWPKIVYWLDKLGGYNSQHTSVHRQDEQLVEMVKAENVIPDPAGDLVTSPGFGEVRATALAGSVAVTGMADMGNLATKFVLVGSDGEHYQDDANPPTAIASGTDFTSGADNLVRSCVFLNFLITCSRSRNIPQTIASDMTRADLGGTPARGVDCKPFAQRLVMFSPSDGSTTYRHLASFNSADNNQAAWTNPYTTNALTFGKSGSKMNILGGEEFKNHLIAFSEDNGFPIYQTSSATIPMAYQPDIINEEGGGPSSIHGVVKTSEALFWISQNGDVKKLNEIGKPQSIGYPVQAFLRGLNDSRRGLIIGGFEPQYRLVVWCMSNGSDTQNKTALLYSLDTKQFFIRTLTRNAFATRGVSGDARLIGGGYAGKFYNEFSTATVGNLDDATALIDADIQFPRLHLGLPGMVKKGVVMAVVLDPIGSETVTVQGNYNDATAFTNLDTTIAVSGTDYITKYFKLNPFEYFQPRFRDATTNERFRLVRVGFSRPTSTYPVHS